MPPTGAPSIQRMIDEIDTKQKSPSQKERKGGRYERNTWLDL